MLHKQMLEIFIQTFFLYFIVIDPLGNTPLFLAVTQNMSSQQRVKTALSATIIASIILLFFALLGSTLLSYFKRLLRALLLIKSKLNKEQALLKLY